MMMTVIVMWSMLEIRSMTTIEKYLLFKRVTSSRPDARNSMKYFTTWRFVVYAKIELVTL